MSFSADKIGSLPTVTLLGIPQIPCSARREHGGIGIRSGLKKRCDLMRQCIATLQDRL